MASIYGTTSSTGWQLRLDYSYTQDIVANTSTITATLYVYAGTSPSYAKSASGTITCDTYNGTTKIGTTTCAFTASVDETACKPTISPTAYDSNSTTVALTGDSSKFVKFFSNATVSVVATAKNSATTRETYSVNCGGKSISTASGTINGVESGSITFSAVDSRGLVASQTLQKTLVEYIKLTCDLQATSSTTDGKATLKVSGNYFNSSFGKTSNTLTVYYRYKTQGGTYSSWTSAGTTTLNGNKYSCQTILSGLDYTQTYIFQARAVDKLTDISSVELERTTTPIFDWGKDGFSFNVPVSFQGKTLSEMLSLNGDAITGVLPISKGGTGATTQADALANLKALPLAGGTMDAGGSIKHPGNASAWNKGRENAVLRRPNAPAGEAWYYPLVSSKTVNGDWTIGNLSDGLFFNYTEDALYNSTTNSNTRQFLFNSDGNFYYPGGKTLIVSGTLGASASSTLSASFDGRIFKNLVVLIRSVVNSGNKYSTFTIPAIADVWGLFLPTYNDYYRVAITISGSDSGMSVMLQMDSNVSGTPAYIYGTA